MGVRSNFQVGVTARPLCAGVSVSYTMRPIAVIVHVFDDPASTKPNSVVVRSKSVRAIPLLKRVESGAQTALYALRGNLIFQVPSGKTKAPSGLDLLCFYDSYPTSLCASMLSTAEPSEAMTNRSVYVVGMGASAGGLEALQTLFRSLPRTGRLAFVAVTHLARDRESLLPEILARDTTMNVLAAQDGMSIEPDTIYLNQPNTILTLEGGKLRATEQTASTPVRNLVDLFFTSLAHDQHENAVGIILSGTGHDGTLGIKAIKANGGLTMAQVGDGAGVRHEGMPESAIASGLVDLALPVAEMAERLLEISRSDDLLEQLEADRQNKTRARLRICEILRERTGHDFSGYKENTFMRRIRRRMQVLKLSTLDAFIEALNKDPNEASLLFRDLLIGVTGFFRDSEAFDTLRGSVIPKLFAGKGARDMVRVWIPGCATGEEAYTVAMLLMEHAEHLKEAPQISVFATDIDEVALGVARSGRYPRALIRGIEPGRLERFFVLDGANYVVTRPLRDLCIFSSHNLIRDPPLSRMDMISCRNLLIYVGAALQGDVLSTFHYALRPGGYLFLGVSENIGKHADLFAPIDKKSRLYQRRDHAVTQISLPVSSQAQRGSRRQHRENRRLSRGTINCGGWSRATCSTALPRPSWL